MRSGINNNTTGHFESFVPQLPLSRPQSTMDHIAQLTDSEYGTNPAQRTESLSVSHPLTFNQH